MSASVVQVSNIAAKTEDKEIKDFFSFCGKISNIDVTTEGTTKSATVTFEKETAAKTALLLNHTKLGENEITVTSTGSQSDDESHYKSNAERDSDELTQEEKPRARILAEYLAHGYVVADAGLNSAIALDEKHGVSARFLNTLQGLDAKYHATDRAKTADQSYGITQRANSLLTGLGSYLEQAGNTSAGQRFVKFYTQGQRQVVDIHNEAKRLAELKKQEHGGSSYKAAGLDKVFGAEKPKTTSGGADVTAGTGAGAGVSASGAAPSHVTATEPLTQPTAPATTASNVEKGTHIPQA